MHPGAHELVAAEGLHKIVRRAEMEGGGDAQAVIEAAHDCVNEIESCQSWRGGVAGNRVPFLEAVAATDVTSNSKARFEEFIYEIKNKILVLGYLFCLIRDGRAPQCRGDVGNGNSKVLLHEREPEGASKAGNALMTGRLPMLLFKLRNIFKPSIC